MAKGKQMTEQQAKGAPKGPASFCVPRAAIEALLDAKATAYEVCAYLVLAKHTESTGRYSSASISAVNKATGANKVRGGPVDRAIQRLLTIQAHRTVTVEEQRHRRTKQGFRTFTEEVTKRESLGPILFDRATWHAQTGEILPDGPTERGLVRYVLPDFGEVPADRVWFDSGLVAGFGEFRQPLKALKNAGDAAARLLLAMYAANDMETWGGVRPVGAGAGPWKYYEPWKDAEGKPLADVHLHGGAQLIRRKNEGTVGKREMFSRAWSVPAGSGDWWKAHSEAGGPVWRALEALESAGLVYEVVMVLNRNAEKRAQDDYGNIPDDAEPLYELDTRSAHGYKPEGEEGIGGATAKTAGDLGHPVTAAGGRFDGTYAAIVPKGYPAMIAGIYRLRFRVANPKNAGVRGAWARIHQNNREAFELVQAIRAANDKPALVPPWEAGKPETASPAASVPF